MKVKISNKEIKECLGIKSPEFPKYTTQVLNLANQNSQATRPKMVGQMSELIKEFNGKSIDEWERWYNLQHPNAINTATRKIWEMVTKLKNASEIIDYDMVKLWVKDLIITKTFMGLKFEKAILEKGASLFNTTYKQSTKNDEAKGIDGYIGNIPVSIKPETYRSMKSLQEEIDVKFIFYEKKKDGLSVDYSALSSE